MSLDWERSAGEVYIQRHGSVAYWIDLLDDDGSVVGGPPRKTLRQTKGGRAVLNALDSAYDRVFAALRIVPESRIVERLDEFETCIRSATESIRSKSSASSREKFAALFQEEEARALGALRSIVEEKPAVVRAKKEIPTKQRLPAEKKRSPRKDHGIGPVKTEPQKKIGAITVKASATDGVLTVSWTAPKQPIAQLAGWLVVVKVGGKILESLVLDKKRREATYSVGENIPDTVIVYARRGSGHAARATTRIVMSEATERSG